MKKRILSLLLVMAMLLGVVPMIGAAEETSKSVWYGRSLTLGSGIAINFVTNEPVEDFGKVEFEVDGEVVQRYSTAAESFAFTRLTPSMLGKDVTAKMYNSADELIGEITTNVLSYCEDALDGDNAALKKLCVDLLNYGAATQAYTKSTDALVNADLTEVQQALGTSEYFPVKLATDLRFHDYGEETSATWYGAGLVLNDSITLCLQFTSVVEPGYVKVLDDGYTLGTITAKLVNEQTNLYEAYYNGLTPADFSVDREFIVYDAAGGRISQKLYYSMESYAYSVKNDPTNNAAQVELIDALIAYCRSACELNGHSYTYGVCDSCGVEKVESMTSDTITIQAEDAVLNVYNKNNEKNLDITTTGEESTVYTNNRYSGITYTGVTTAEDDEGAIIVYVTPQTSGTFTVNANVYHPKTGAIGILVEDDSTTAASTYTRTPWSVISSSTSDFKTFDMGTHEWTAGKTYAIRILAASSGGIYFDEFVITKQQEEHVHSAGDTWTTDETGHWKVCTGCEEKVDYAEHTYTNGVCECGKERVFTVNGDTTIQAEDAILNLTGDQSGAELKFFENANAGGGKLVLSQKVYSSYTNVTAATAPGNIIVKFIPAETGTYYIHAKVLDNGGALGAMVVEEDDTTTAYVRAGITETDNITTFSYAFIQSTADFVWGQIGSGYELEAGKTYAIRILCTTANLVFDEFVISTSSATPS